jgi:thioredoxin-like negative regulator of GroEL
MILLQTQEQFEELYSTSLKRPTLIYFTANWCAPCKKLDWNVLLPSLDTCDVYKCDISENTYTPGYCGVKSIPSFLFMLPGKKLEPLFQSSDTTKVSEWISTIVSKK